MRCGTCGAEAAKRARFCDQCGAALPRTTDPPRPAAEAAVTTEAIVATEAADRRVVTALFADLVDYVRMIAEQDAEEVRTRVRVALGRMAETVEHLGGTREKFIGDALFAVFGWPTAHDDDAIRAALAALEIRAALRDSEEEGESLEVRIGIATGEVVASDRPPVPGHTDLALTGAAITTAARIQSLARPGEILIDEATVRIARDRLLVEDRGSVVLRGQADAVRLFALGGETGLGRVGSSRPIRKGPFVGRRLELARLRGLLEDCASTGRGGVAFVVGDAGEGKTRLVAELRAPARHLGYRWTWTENVSYGTNEPYRFARLFAQAMADEHGTDSGSFARQMLFTEDLDEATVRRFGGAIATVARDAAFAGWEQEATDMPSDPGVLATTLTEVAARYLTRIAQTDGPRVVVIDDMHWLDPSSTGMVEMLARLADTLPFVIVATARPGVNPAFLDAPSVIRVDLAGLAAPDTARLATLVARAALDEEAARRIHERTDGNPLFIGETVRAYVEAGALETRDGRATIVESITPHLPLTLRSVLGARIDALPEPSRSTLGVASVVGIRFEESVIAALMDESPPADVFRRLEDAALVVPDEPGRWRFAHALIQDAAHAGLLASRRRRLHGRLADLMERGEVPGTVGRIASHRAEAGDAARAVPLLANAAEEALALGAAAEAIGFWRDAARLSVDPVAAERFEHRAMVAQAAAESVR